MNSKFLLISGLIFSFLNISLAQEVIEICGTQHFTHCFTAGEIKMWHFQAAGNGRLQLKMIDRPANSQVRIWNLLGREPIYEGNGMNAIVDSYYYEIDESGNSVSSWSADLFVEIRNNDYNTCQTNGIYDYPVKFEVQTVAPVEVLSRVRPDDRSGKGSVTFRTHSDASSPLYRVDDGAWQSSPTFNNLISGNHEVSFWSSECATTKSVEFFVNPLDHPDIWKIEKSNARFTPDSYTGSFRVWLSDGSEYTNYTIFPYGGRSNAQNMVTEGEFALLTFGTASGYVAYGNYRILTDYRISAFAEEDCQRQSYTAQLAISNPVDVNLIEISHNGAVIATGSAQGVFELGEYDLNASLQYQVEIDEPLTGGRYFVTQTLIPKPCERICAPQRFEYCYENFDYKTFRYQSTTGQPLNIYFFGGTIISGDYIRVYDGDQTSDPLLYQGSDRVAGVDLTTTNPAGKLLVIIYSNEGGSCATSHDPRPLIWEVRADFPFLDTYNLYTPSCSNNADGLIEFAGPPELEYTIDGGQSWHQDGMFTDLPEGIYDTKMRIIGDNGLSCVTNIGLGETHLRDADAPTIENVNIQYPANCSSNDGFIQVIATGNNLEYSINNGNSWQPSTLFANLGVGKYQPLVRSRDYTFCQVSEKVELIASTSPTITGVTTFQPTTCNARDGLITLQTTAPAGVTLIYSNNDGQTWQSSPNFVSAAGTYQLRVRDIDNEKCFSARYDYELTSLDAPDFINADFGGTTCEVTNGYIEISTDRNSDFLFSFDNGKAYTAANRQENLGTGLYQIGLKSNSSDCEYEFGNIVLSPDNPPALEAIGGVATAGCGVEDGRIDFMAAGSFANLEFTIDNGQTFQSSPNFANLSAGKYLCGVRYANGSCLNIVNEIEIAKENALEYEYHTYNDCTSQNFSVEIKILNLEGGESLTVTDSKGYTRHDVSKGDRFSLPNYSIDETVQINLLHPNQSDCNQSFTASGDCALAVAAVEFSGKAQIDKNYLQWKVKSVAEVEQFIISKSTHNSPFAIWKTISSERQIYSYELFDDQPNLNTIYQLAAQSSTGKITILSHTKIVRTDATAVQIFPNPTTNRLNISTLSKKYLPADYQIVNSLGQTVDKGIISHLPMQISVENLPTGTYFFTLQANETFSQQIFLKQ